MGKPWDETWHMTAMGGVGDAAGPPYGWIAGFVQAGESASRPADTSMARARLAAAAPDLVRALLAVEWQHDSACARQAALRKAGVIE